jgi:hypothetical protein
MKRETYQYYLFFSAALFNWVMGLMLLLLYRPFLELLMPGSVPEHPLFVHLFAVIIVMVGFGYYWARYDLNKYREVIKIGAMAKTPVFLVGLFYWLDGTTPWSIAVLTSIDLVYAVLFTHALRQLQQPQRLQPL